MLKQLLHHLSGLATRRHHELRFLIVNLKEQLMSALDTLNEKLDSANASAEAANTKADALIEGYKTVSGQVDGLKQQIADLQAAGANNVTDEQLAALGAKADAIKATLDTQSGEDDAALNPTPAPAPEPAPEPTPEPAPTDPATP